MDSKGAETLIFMGVWVPGGFLFDKRVRGQGAVRGPGGEVQDWSPLSTATNWHVTAAVPGQTRDWRQQIHIPDIRPHLKAQLLLGSNLQAPCTGLCWSGRRCT
ncbi:hypothetical protein XELAEV_18035022mg [Xenopus laevis]|uniref:Uncharacterized protein n=1 Tax=Xenopus laevis TaxID=8355 RepID=A0A974CF70_XENLA|nr:hypothetical protein XELAEV_18035022mg [Xenopus laevis]